MPERGFATETWDDSWFEKLEPMQRYLFIYLWTNGHCNQAGLYEITLKKMAAETRLSQEELETLLKSLYPKVDWYPDLDLVWVKNFLRKQSKSPKFFAAAAKCLKLVSRHKELIREYLSYNSRYGITIPYQDTLSDTISDTHARAGLVWSSSSANAISDKQEGKGDEGPGEEPIGNPQSGAVPRAEISVKSAVSRAMGGTAPSGGARPPNSLSPATIDLVDLYEKNLGLSPSSREYEDLKTLPKDYPVDWIKTAFVEAKRSNGKSLRYVMRILNRYENQGGPDANSGHRSASVLPRQERELEKEAQRLLRGIQEED